MTAKKSLLVALAGAALLAAGAAQAASHRHPHRHHARLVRGDPRDVEGVYTRFDDRIYGGSYYGFFTSPLYGRFEGY